MFKVHNRLTVALAEPQSLPTIDRLRQLTGCRIKPVLSLEQGIKQFIDRFSQFDTDFSKLDDLVTGSEDDLVAVLQDQGVAGSGAAVNLDQPVEASESDSVVGLVNTALLTAIRDRASDVHIEPTRTGTRMRYRLDGVLHDLIRPPAGLHPAIVSRVKVISQMDIAEKRLPQEGRVRLVAMGREVDLRVSSMPTLLGEKIVIRLLDKSNLKVRMEDLGFRPEALGAFMRMLNQPHGLVLVTGPTGSGKTTTLYSALHAVHNTELNIVTVEDPVEYQIEGINQVQVHESIGMGFARALRSILRQDPDVIMVGEVRDEETARVAVQAALTGHLVLATLHTNDAPGAVGRLLDMDVRPYLLSAAINGVVAQRLARTNCPNCTEGYEPEARTLRDAGLEGAANAAFKKGAGCSHCRQSGFKGRVGIYEVMEINGSLRRLIHKGEPAHSLREAMCRAGGLTLREEGKRVALSGKTSLEEVIRVTQDDSEPGDGRLNASES